MAYCLILHYNDQLMGYIYVSMWGVIKNPWSEDRNQPRIVLLHLYDNGL